jgi:hypothetical protein
MELNNALLDFLNQNLDGNAYGKEINKKTTQQSFAFCKSSLKMAEELLNKKLRANKNARSNISKKNTVFLASTVIIYS